MLIQILLDKHGEAAIVGALLVFNAAISFIEEGRANKVLALLRSQPKTQARVLREICTAKNSKPLCRRSTVKSAHRWTSTGTLQCVRTLIVSLPRTIAEMPWRPCEAMTIRSQRFASAMSMIAR
jgi:hypothetical protein